MDKSILEAEQEFYKDSVKPDSKINNIMFDIELELSDKLRKFGHSFSWKKFYSKNDKHCIVEFAAKSKEAVDWLILILEKLQINYGFINLSTLEFDKYTNTTKGQLCIEA